MKLGELIKEYRNKNNITIREFAERSGVSRSYLSQLEKDKEGVRVTTLPKLKGIARAMEISLEELMRTMDDMIINPPKPRPKDEKVESAFRAMSLQPVPIFDPISFGTDAWIDEIPTDFVGIPIDVTKTDQVYFANRAQGNSMEPHIKNGDYLIFEKTEQIDSGKIGSFSLNGQYYCKRFKRLADGSAWLFSDNGDYEPIPIYPEDDFRTLGLYRFKLSKEQ